MNNIESNTGEIVMYELTNVKLLFITDNPLEIKQLFSIFAPSKESTNMLD